MKQLGYILHRLWTKLKKKRLGSNLTVWLLYVCLIQELLERQLEYERVRLEAESKKATLEYQEKVRKSNTTGRWNIAHLSAMDSLYLNPEIIYLSSFSLICIILTRHSCLLYFVSNLLLLFFLVAGTSQTSTSSLHLSFLSSSITFHSIS